MADLNFWIFVPSVYLLFMCVVAKFLLAARDPDEVADMKHEVLCLYCNKVVDKEKLYGITPYPKT